MAWQDKVKEAIAAQCMAAYMEANTARIKRGKSGHVPYCVPELAEAMLGALNRDDEHEGKRLLLIYRTGSVSLI